MIALDTNVLIYCCDRRDSRRQQLALDLVAGTGDGVLPWQVACEFIAASRKLAGQGFTAGQAWQRLAEFLALFR
jgi:predicted nucleic acid-binding protein